MKKINPENNIKKADIFVTQKKNQNHKTITRTIRFDGDIFDEIEELAERDDVSVNNLVNQLVKFALNHAN